jgi:hypothetical protein
MEADGRTVIRGGACNNSAKGFAGDKCSSRQVSLFDGNGYLVEGARLEQLGSVVSHEAVFPLKIRRALPKGDYHLAYCTSNDGFAVVQSSIVEQDGARYLKTNPDLVCPQTDFTIVTAD